MGISPRRTLECDGSGGFGLGGGCHLGNPHAGGERIVFHDLPAYPSNAKGASGGLRRKRLACKGAAISYNLIRLRSDKSSEGKEWVSTCYFGWSRYHLKKKTKKKKTK